MKKFLIGCGITVLVLAALGFGTSFYLFNKLKQELAVSEQVESRRHTLRDEYGEPSTFVPTTTFAPERFAKYLQIRESVHAFVEPRIGDAAGQLEQAKDQTDKGFVQKIRGLSNMMRGGVGALRVGLTAMALRDSLLLETAMPEGEYVYYHCLAVYSWLEWTPPERTADTRLLDDEDWDKALKESREELRSVYLDILHNQAGAMAEREDLTPEDEAYRTVLAEQLGRRWHRTDEWPLQGVLPQTLIALLAPSEARLRATLPRDTIEFFIDTMSTHMELENEKGLQIQFD